MNERQSDGVEFCIIPEFHDNKIYFYCHEYVMFWNTIEDVGNFNKCCNFNLKDSIRPATLTEICNENLSGFVNSVKEYTIENNVVVDIKYINLL